MLLIHVLLLQLVLLVGGLPHCLLLLVLKSQLLLLLGCQHFKIVEFFWLACGRMLFFYHALVTGYTPLPVNEKSVFVGAGWQLMGQGKLLGASLLVLVRLHRHLLPF